MATNQTEHYKLNQWELTDSVVMADFNADNAKLEQALLDLKDSLPRFRSGSYTGTGTYGSDAPNTLTFDFPPQVVLIAAEAESASCISQMLCIRGADTTIIPYDRQISGSTYGCAANHLLWSDNTLTWYSSSAATQFNADGLTYRYLAIG